MGAAQLVALVAPLENLENTIDRIREDHVLTSQVAQSIYVKSDWDTAINEIAAKLCDRLQVSGCMILQASGKNRYLPRSPPL